MTRKSGNGANAGGGEGGSAYVLAPMTAEAAYGIAAWTYPPPMAAYSMRRDEATLRELMGYVQARAGDAVAGFFCYGASARIPAVEADAYREDALDIGLGLRPDLCGAGRGPDFVRAGIAYADANGLRAGRPMRLSVWDANARARRAYERVGFREVRRITHAKTGTRYVVMVYER